MFLLGFFIHHTNNGGFTKTYLAEISSYLYINLWFIQTWLLFSGLFLRGLDIFKCNFK